MSYPYLPVNPCCTEVVLNSPCGCSSTITNGGCNDNPCGTHLTASSTIVYDGPALSCTTAEPCDTLNVILQKIDEIICNLLTQINILNIQINNINNQILIIEGDIFNIYNQLGECCTTTTSTSSSSTTTSTTTIHPCEQFSLNNTGVDPVAIIITDCTTQDPEAIILMPGDTNICVVTDSPLTVPGTVIVTPNGPCIPPTSSTTTTTSSSTSTSTSSTTTTTTTAIPCECLTFYNGSRATQEIIYIDCNGETQFDLIDIGATNSYCGCCGEAATPDVTISIGADCIGGLCPEISTSTTTTTTTAYVLACTAGYTGPVGFPNRTTGNGTMTLGSGLVINTTYTGPALLTGPQPPYTNCVGGQLAGNVGIGGTISLNYNGGAFTFTITYSTPQTAVKFVLSGIGYADQLGISEYYTVTTSAANTVVNLIDGCGDFRVEAPNVVAGSMQNPIDRIGGNIEVVADTSFTTITITGNNSASLAGTAWDMYICDAESTTTTTSSSSTSTTTSSSTSTTTSTTTICQDCIAHDVTIGTQVWTGCNLDVTTYRNGDPIPEVTDLTTWGTLTTGAWCYIFNDSANGPGYGKLYNWYAVNDPRGLAPVGYHIPSDAEFTILTNYLGGEATSGSALKETGRCHWGPTNSDSTNSTGLALVGSGMRSRTPGPTDPFMDSNLLSFSTLWSSDEYTPFPSSAIIRYVQVNQIYVVNYWYPKNYGFSVRCIKDTEPTTTTTSSSTSTTTSTSSSSTTTTTTTAFVGACTCMTVTIAQTDLDDATGNTTPGIVNNAVELRTTKDSGCDDSEIDRTYTDAMSEGWCIKTASISTIQMFYYKNNAPIYLPAIDSTYTILYSACTLNGDCEITTTTTSTSSSTTTTTTTIAPTTTTTTSLGECLYYSYEGGIDGGTFTFVNCVLDPEEVYSVNPNETGFICLNTLINTSGTVSLVLIGNCPF